MSHFILPTLNAFLYCVIFMVVTVSCGIIYALFKWFCSDDDDEHERNTRRETDYEADHDYTDNGFTSVHQPHVPTMVDDDPAPQYIPLMPVPKQPSPRASPIPFSTPYPPTTTPYPSGSSAAPYPPSNQESSLPYPTGGIQMPMPMPTPQYPASNPLDSPPSYQDAMVQPAYNPNYKGN